MDKNPADEIQITALIKRFTDHRLPRILDLKKRVFSGEKLSKSDVIFLDIVFRDAKYTLNFSDKYPEYQEMMSKVLELYTEITEKALKNEQT